MSQTTAAVAEKLAVHLGPARGHWVAAELAEAGLLRADPTGKAENGYRVPYGASADEVARLEQHLRRALLAHIADEGLVPAGPITTTRAVETWCIPQSVHGSLHPEVTTRRVLADGETAGPGEVLHVQVSCPTRPAGDP